MKRPRSKADTHDSSTTSGHIGSLRAKGALEARLLPGNKNVDVGPVHHLFGIIRRIYAVPANRPEVLDEWRQVGRRQIGVKSHVTLETSRVQTSTGLVVFCGFLKYIAHRA